LIPNVEASLLSSKHFEQLCKKIVVAVIKQADSSQFRQELSIPCLNSWIVVLDGKGETLASWFGDMAGAGCNSRSADTFPRNLVKLIRKRLERQESVEALERRCKSQPADSKTFEAFAGRLAEMFAFGKLRKHCEEASRNHGLSKLLRDEFRIRAFTARASDYFGESFTEKIRAQFVHEGERLLVELAGHPKASALVDALFSRGFTQAFDVPGKTAQAISRLEKASRPGEPTPLKERIQEFSKMREEWMAETKKSLMAISDKQAKDHIAASLGDPQAAMRLCSRPPYSELPQYQEWALDAKRKIR
jgi:hypothetical protein